MGGIVGHELGHLTMATAYGSKARLHAGSIVYPGNNFSEQELLRVSTAGFQAQWLLSEWAFYELDQAENALLDRQHYIGLISSHLAISFVYMAGLKDHPNSDIYAASTLTKRSRTDLALMALIPAAIDSYRLFGSDVPAWLDYAAISIKVGEIGLIWKF